MFKIEYASKKGSRNYNEDYVYIKNFKSCNVIAIFDGHNGTSCIEYFIKLFENTFNCSNINQNYLKSLFVSIDNKIVSKNINSGSCVTMIIILYNTTYILQLGDTKAILFKDSLMVYETPEHNFYNSIEYNRCLFNMQIVHNIPRYDGILSVTRSLGDSELKNKINVRTLISIPSIKILNTNDFDTIIMTTDGIHSINKPSFNTNISIANEYASKPNSDNCTIIKITKKEDIISNINKLV
ncbi:ORF MSV135 putative protein phosphatase 2C (PP2C), similar to Schizosaccharomyces pombe SW:P40371 [Melanoplus sanguinipes entomopoxvirus]|uniref:protein-serine/threonine phosphatase n=1 Tax=Melanoplus sanguinipes entomopoxvirus TaxID=83191 RepID=Q9YVV7_MSEPV|nr:ORF MSV135 putative protein phosphatase 2C (PP2C), similar to Schizosaccharomyces pombe SW:P40371 [Melanoplus sanguinipes entomopoxvirus]AAC97791.1 ORF MSV135 putative protein phosphatase 2C (PP2C), similar to Schizosaccharomyces pombe SW:P40371 [Melanoplus sanguinipes entomopoxvirus 'O']